MEKQLHTLLEQALRLKERNDFTGALQLLSTAVEECPDRAAAFGLIGGIYYFELNQAQEAVRWFKEAARLTPCSEVASLGLFHSLWDLGLQDEALTEMKRFQSIAPSTDYEEISAELEEKGILP